MSLGLPRILIADDEPQLLKVVIRVLEKHGYPVVSAVNGDDAIRAFRAVPDEIGVVILDAAITPNGSQEVFEAVVAQRPQTGVIVISGELLSESFRELVVAHDGIFLRKPFPPKALLRAVEDSQIKEES